jgi:hypothetical protein
MLIITNAVQYDILTSLINSVIDFTYETIPAAFDLNGVITCNGIMSCSEIIPCGE